MWIAGGVFALLVALALVLLYFFVFKKSSKPNSQPSPSPSTEIKYQLGRGYSSIRTVVPCQVDSDCGYKLCGLGDDGNPQCCPNDAFPFPGKQNYNNPSGFSKYCA
jgi:hypothetical protein